MKQKLKWDEWLGIFLLAVSFGLLGVCIFLSFGNDLWYDEVFTMGLANQPIGELLSLAARDVHPPLYYLIVKLFLILTAAGGGSIPAQVFAAKLASVFPFFLCLVYAATKIRKRFGIFPAGFFGFLLLTMPQMAGYTVEVRMYGYALFFVTAGMIHAGEIAGRSGDQKTGKGSCRQWIWLTVYLEAACYTHYFACVAAGMIYCYLLLAFWRGGSVKEKIRTWLASVFCCAIGYLPWITLALIRQVGQVKENYWIQPLSWRTLGGCVKFLFQPAFTNGLLNVVLAVLLFLIYGGALAGGWLQGRKEEKRDGQWFTVGCIGILAGLVGFGFLASFLLRPVFVYRYMFPALGAFWLAFALSVFWLKDKKYFFVPVMLLVLVVGVRNFRAFYGEEMWKRLQMAQAQEILEQIGEEDVLIFNFDQVQAVTACYLPNSSYLWYGQPEELIREMLPQVYPLVEGEFTDEAGIAKMLALLEEKGQLWFAGSGNAREEIIRKWENAGMEAEETASVMIERYWFNLYKIYIK